MCEKPPDRHALVYPVRGFAAETLGLSLGTIGSHLTVLRDARLIVGARVGRRVVYRRTEAGDLLAGKVCGW